MKPSSSIASSGISYKSVEDTIEQIADAKAYQYRKVGYFDQDDIRQEIRIKCWTALPRFDPACGANLKVFLSVCGENRIRDIRRSVLYKHNRPCFKCPFWNEVAAQSGIHDCLVFEDKMECDKFAKHERYVQAKLSASHPIDINNERIEDINFDRRVGNIDFIDYVHANLPSGLFKTFDKLSSSNFNLHCLKPKERSNIIGALKIILKDYKI